MLDTFSHHRDTQAETVSSRPERRETKNKQEDPLTSGSRRRGASKLDRLVVRPKLGTYRYGPVGTHEGSSGEVGMLDGLSPCRRLPPFQPHAKGHGVQSPQDAHLHAERAHPEA